MGRQARQRWVGRLAAQSVQRLLCALGVLCVLSAGCGYGSRYPEPVTRSGAPLAGDSGVPSGELPCSSSAPVSVAYVTFINVVPVQLGYVGPDCVEVMLQQVNAAYAGYTLQLSEGSIITVRDLQGALLTWVEVPDTGGAAWSVEVP
jgi:hypothetical protein